MAVAPDGEWRSVSTIDVSKGGFGFVSQEKIALDAFRYFRLKLPNDAGMMAVQGRIVHCMDLAEAGVYRIGVQAIRVDVLDVTETPESIHEFWFGTQSDDAAAAAEKAKLWWAKDAATDALMRQRFEPMLALAASGALDSWTGTPQGRLALILLADQFPRNIYRQTARSFAYDSQALAWCKEGLRLGSDRQLRPIERVFHYLPLEHSESLEDQNLAVSLFAQLMEEVPPEQKTVFAGFHDFAVRHRVIIERFQRFPHRNAILDRPSTAEETAFLQEKGSSF